MQQQQVGFGAAASQAPVPFAHVSTAGTDLAGAQAAQWQRQRERQSAQLSPAEVAAYRSGWSRLVSIRDFVASHAALQARLREVCSALDNAPGQQPPDLDVEELRVDAPFERIQKEIDREVERVIEVQRQARDANSSLLALEKAKARELLAQQTHQKRMQAQQQRDGGLATGVIAQAAVAAMATGVPHNMAAAETASATIQHQQQQQQPSSSQSEHNEQQSEQQPADDDMMDTQPAHVDASQQSTNAPAAAGSGASLADGLTLSQLQSAQPVALSQSESQSQSRADPPSMLTEAIPSSAAAVSPPADVLLTSGISASAVRSTKAVPDLPADFGAGVPLYRDLLNPLQPSLEARARQLGKRSRADANCMTVALQQRDKQKRLEYAGSVSSGAPTSLAVDEVILRVALYHPHRHNKQQEFLVLASQPLTALRDALDCLQDRVLDGQHTPSSCFFIENVFYDDLRQSNAIRLSDPVVQWVRAGGHERQVQLGTFRQESMATCFASLSVRLGAHYFFQHQGDCRHVLIVTEMRMAHRADEQDSRAYPLRVFQARPRRQMCGVCDQLPAAYVAYGDKLAATSPCFYCEQCYEPLHYSKDGQLLYDDFQVFPYEQD